MMPHFGTFQFRRWESFADSTRTGVGRDRGCDCKVIISKAPGAKARSPGLRDCGLVQQQPLRWMIAHRGFFVWCLESGVKDVRKIDDYIGG